MISYKPCFTCGKYFIPSNENRTFCSEECSKNFVKCVVCGNYYPIEDEREDKKINRNEYTCSEICKKKYKFKRKQDLNKLDFSNL